MPPVVTTRQQRSSSHCSKHFPGHDRLYTAQSVRLDESPNTEVRDIQRQHYHLLEGALNEVTLVWNNSVHSFPSAGQFLCKQSVLS